MMVHTYDIEAMVFRLLNENGQLKGALSGGVYLGQRPQNSEKEDVVVNTISLTQEHKPQLATSNVNIHVPDRAVNIGGIQQVVEDRTRLKKLTGLALGVLRGARFDGLKVVIESQNTLREAEISQHFVNIRIRWIIH